MLTKDELNELLLDSVNVPFTLTLHKIEERYITKCILILNAIPKKNLMK